jgi:transposase
MGLTGETQFIPGGRKQPGKTCGQLTHLKVEWRPGLHGSATIGPVTTPDNPPDELDALKAALRVEREARQQAEARASSAEAMVAYYKLQIAKLRREHYGQSSERGRKLLDQLELQLEEAAASAAEDEIAAAPVGSTTVHPFTRRKPARARFPAHLPRERVVIPGPSACPCCGGRLAKLGETITETL